LDLEKRVRTLDAVTRKTHAPKSRCLAPLICGCPKCWKSGCERSSPIIGGRTRSRPPLFRAIGDCQLASTNCR
jgi:hypothetical protein